jgi:hypothetical protein
MHGCAGNDVFYLQGWSGHRCGDEWRVRQPASARIGAGRASRACDGTTKKRCRQLAIMHRMHCGTKCRQKYPYFDL